MGKVSHLFTGSTSLTVEQALDDARSRHSVYPLSDVLIVGWDDDGEFYAISSTMTRQQALWLADKACDHARGNLSGS